MNEEEREIEGLLGHYRPAAPRGAVRDTVVRRARGRRRWAWLEAAAAVLLIGLNFAQIGGSLARLSSQPAMSDLHTREIARALARLDVSLSADQQQLMARQLAAGEELRLLPLVHGKINATSAGVLQ